MNTSDFQTRVNAYKDRYGAHEKLSPFSYNSTAEQIVYRNEALRTKNRKLYADYLAQYTDIDLEQELKIFDSLLTRVVRLNRSSFLSWTMEKGVKLVESDIHIFDENAILKGIRLDDQEEDAFDVEASWEELIHNIHFPEQLAKEREFFWILDE